jgi:AICAR transformylase/IMP cyclohydrolase PurH
VLVLPEVKYYAGAREELARNKLSVSLEFRRTTAAAAFAATSAYDGLIAGWLAASAGQNILQKTSSGSCPR